MKIKASIAIAGSLASIAAFLGFSAHSESPSVTQVNNAPYSQNIVTRDGNVTVNVGGENNSNLQRGYYLKNSAPLMKGPNIFEKPKGLCHAAQGSIVRVLETKSSHDIDKFFSKVQIIDGPTCLNQVGWVVTSEKLAWNK